MAGLAGALLLTGEISLVITFAFVPVVILGTVERRLEDALVFTELGGRQGRLERKNAARFGAAFWILGAGAGFEPATFRL